MTSDRFPLSKRAINGLRIGFVVLAVGFLLSRVVPLRAALGDYDIAQEPLYTKQSQPPLMMMVMSRDEQLFNKAYSDYSDLDDDKIIDTTYQDKFSYSGYFDSNLCYGYASSVFKASGEATGTNKHECGGAWSGNFLNWVTMSRLDVMRYVLYGGQRSTDDANKTVIERAQIPNDLHAWVKVYTGSDIGKFTPLTASASFCNASISAGGAPLMRVAGGNWSEWASTASYQCGVNRSGEGSADTPKAVVDYTVRVEVCDPGQNSHRESFCRKYNDGTTDHYKPSGLLQTYGESGRLRFGLVSGTYSSPRDGGVLRRNIGKIAGNGAKLCDTGDEINLATGQLCLARNSGTEGIINTMSNFRIDQWNWSNNWNDCNDYSILNRQGFGDRGNLLDPGASGDKAKKCSAWGNPLAEMYAEALRYVGAGTKVYGDTGDLSGLPVGVTWKDPYRSPAQGGNSYCATCNILVMSSGLPSFDSDNVGAVPHLATAESATDALGAAEGINGKSYLAGRVGATARYASINTHEDICQALTVNQLSLVRGICPDIPSTEGSYLLAGLSKAAAETDLRPGLAGKPADYKVTATTYTVAMAENLPKFDISVAGGTISLSPLCQANNTGGAKAADAGWRSCFLGSVGIGTKEASVAPKHIYGRPYRADGKSGSFSLVWEDSLWGNDHDNDVVTMMSYCVGAACGDKAGIADMCWRSPNNAVCSNQLLNATIGEDEVLVRLENLSAYAGNAMLTGYTIVGSNAASNVQRLLLRPGNSNGSVISSTENPPNDWTKPSVVRYKLSGAQANQLQSPLWYAAKYGVPSGKWDTREAGVPDNYFLARNPAKLKAALEAIFESAAEGDAPVGGGGTGSRISTGSFTVSASYKVPSGTNDWTGDVVATKVGALGADGDVLWRASTKMSSSGRNIVMATAPTTVSGSGTLVPVAAAPFEANNIPGADRAAQLGNLGFSSSVPSWFGSHTVADLVNYLKGSAISGFRSRSAILGDIVNSTTEIVSTADNFGYGSWTATPTWKATLGSRYRAYLAAKKAAGGPPTMLYVGANDGMLHGFDASTGASAGSEVLAFIPSSSLQHMAELANPSYSHRYYVDGALTSSDVYYGDAWHTVLVGSTGAGGANRAPNAAAVGNGSMFALNVSNPTGFTKDNVLWELSGKTDSDMGFALGKPIIVPVSGADANAAPRFVAIFGNGINSSSGKPVLFVVDIQTGQVLNRLSPSGGGYALRNGLMNVVAVAASNNNRIADTVYGGDMQGNLWKFDLRDPDPANWAVAYSGAPLFTASRNGVAQPITGGFEVTRAAGRGYNILFGTGQYFASDDNAVSSNSPVQSLYSVWDNLATTVGSRDDLVAQQISLADDGYRYVSANAVSYVSKRGWYVDLIVGGVVDGERFIGNPRIQSGAVFFNSYVPGQAVCGGGGGINWRYSLSLLTGAGALGGLSDTPGGDPLCTGNCGGAKLTSGGKDSNGPPMRDNNIFLPNNKLQACDPADPACGLDDLLKSDICTYVLRTGSADPLYMPRPCGRQSWRQVR
ncbi:pilus assembly protein [Stenotrophomonas rhizophila]|uniref:Type IV pilus assembly protein PilY1 n=1 Tax=Stenotrophomonas rhizophila TaxID=216778 RepID=A0AAW5PIK7_9GAMM|nr:PilC/PilY family type IV pilus protein [Stenotrophomonas rhizophila]MCS4279502.1 type IV pilus assembly protein PilY1 [Stenotrophomonas rhizophila]